MGKEIDLARRLRKLMAVSKDDEFQTIRHFQFGKDGCEIMPHGHFADGQAISDLLVSQTLSSERNYFAFPFAQPAIFIASGLVALF